MISMTNYVSDNTSHAIRKEKSLSICLLPHPPRKAMSASCPHSGLAFALNFLQGIQFTLPGLPCSILLAPVHREEETAQQTLVCWPQSET